MGKKTPEEEAHEAMEAFCKEQGVEYHKVQIENDPVWNFLDGDFSTTPDVLIGKKVIYCYTGTPEVKIYVVDEIEKKYAMLTIFSKNALNGILELKQRVHEAQGLEILVANALPNLKEYQQIENIEDLANKQN